MKNNILESISSPKWEEFQDKELAATMKKWREGTLKAKVLVHFRLNDIPFETEEQTITRLRKEFDPSVPTRETIVSKKGFEYPKDRRWFIIKDLKTIEEINDFISDVNFLTLLKIASGFYITEFQQYVELPQDVIASALSYLRSVINKKTDHSASLLPIDRRYNFKQYQKRREEMLSYEKSMQFFLESWDSIKSALINRGYTESNIRSVKVHSSTYLFGLKVLEESTHDKPLGLENFAKLLKDHDKKALPEFSTKENIYLYSVL